MSVSYLILMNFTCLVVVILIKKFEPSLSILSLSVTNTLFSSSPLPPSLYFAGDTD